MTLVKFLTTTKDTFLDLFRILDKLLVYFRFYFDHYSMSKYLSRWGIAQVGDKTWIATNVRFDLFKPAEAKKLNKPLITIGNNCVITEYTQLLTHDTSLNHMRKVYGMSEKRKWGQIIIEDNVFIGVGCIILPGITIHKNSIIGAGSVVTKDVAEGVIVAGNPAKQILTTLEYVED